MGHIPLNSYLHRIGKAPSAGCDACGHPRENVHHYLMRCPKYEPFRQRMQTKLGRKARDEQYLLSDPKAMDELIMYVERTKRFWKGNDQTEMTQGQEEREE